MKPEAPPTPSASLEVVAAVPDSSNPAAPPVLTEVTPVKPGRKRKEKAMGHPERKDAKLFHQVHSALIERQTSWAGWSLLALTVLIAVGLTWAAWAEVEEITMSPGRVVPSSKEQVIQSLEGGILQELLVREGDIVKPQQILLRINDTRTGSSYREGQNKLDSLRATAARLLAEANNTEPKFPPDLAKRRPEVVANEMAAFNARRRSLEESLTFQSKALALAREELALSEPLVEKGMASKVDVIRLQRQVTELSGRLDEQKNKFRADARSEYSKNQDDLNGLGEIVNSRQDSYRRSTIRSPIHGVIKNIRINTIGGVIQPAQDILEIVPIDDSLLVEARVRPADVAFLRPGQEAMVKITAYDYSIYGGLPAILDYISPDTLRDDVKRDETYYRVQLHTKKNVLLDKQGRPLPIIPGMVAQVEIRTGQKTVLSYLLKPILKAQSALRER